MGYVILIEAVCPPHAKEAAPVITRRTVLAGMAACALGLAAAPPVLAQAQGYPQQAASLVSSLGTEAIQTITQAGLSESERVARFRALFVKGFDIPAIARFVLGRYWRTSSPEQQAEF